MTFAPAAPSVTTPLGRPRTGARKSPRTRAILPTVVARRRRRSRAPRQGCNAGPTARGGRKGNAWTASPALTSALTCCASPHSARAWSSLCSGSPAIGEGESRAPEPALRAVAPPARRKAAGATGPQHLRRRAGGGRRGARAAARAAGGRALGGGGACLKGIGGRATLPAGRLRPYPRRRAGYFIVLYSNIFLLRARARASLALVDPGARAYLSSPTHAGPGVPAKGLLGRGGSRSATRRPAKGLSGRSALTAAASLNSLCESETQVFRWLSRRERNFPNGVSSGMN